MTSLSIFQPEITTLEAHLHALQAQLEEVRQAEDIATQLLSTLADTLPRFEKLGAIARIKEAVMGLFGDEQRTNPTSEEIFDAEVLPQPERRNPTRDRFARTLNFNYADCTISFCRDYLLNNAQSFMQAAHFESLTGKAFWSSVDAWCDRYEETKKEPKQLTIEDAIATNTPSVPAEADTPEVEPAPTVEPVSETEQMNYIELVELNPTVAYQRKRDGEIVCAYLGAANQKLANNWAETLDLWGCRIEVRKAKRLSGADIKYEVKIWGISSQQLDQVAANHTSPFQSVPAPKATRLSPEKKNADQPNPSAPAGGELKQAATSANEPKPQVSLVLGNADNIYISYFVMVGDRTLGRVEKLSATSAWSVPGMPGTWETREAAADALIAKREADRKLHQDTNDLLRTKYGLPV